MKMTALSTEGGSAYGGSCHRQTRLWREIIVCVAAGLPPIAFPLKRIRLLVEVAALGIGLNMFAPTLATGATLSTNTAWAWMKGSTTTNQTGTYGTQGVPASTNTPGARYSAVSWTDGTGALWLFGGSGYPASGSWSQLNDLWKYDPATTNWTWIKGANSTNQSGTYGTQGVESPTNTPGARQGAVSWMDTNNALWLFGGSGYDASGISWVYFNDLWKFDPATTNWTWIKGANTNNQSGTYGTQGVPDPANTPGARDRAASWTDGTGALWLFGGFGYSASGSWWGRFNDLWKFDPATTNWTWIKGANTINQSGTYGTQGAPDPANTPGARTGAVSWTDGTGALWLFGGWGFPASGSYDLLNDLWKYDPATTNWTWMKGTNSANQSGTYGTQGVPAVTNTPGARQGAVSWMDTNNALWLFGGSGYDASVISWVSFNDLWKYDPATTNWTWMKGTNTNYQPGTYGTQGVPAATNTPGARQGAVSWTDGTGALWLFGGLGYGASGMAGDLNDLWKLSDSGFIGVVGPLITANDLVGDVHLNSGDPVTIAVQMMNIEPYLGVEVDWWVVAFAHSGQWYYLDNSLQWQEALFSGDFTVFHPVYQGPLFHLSSVPVLSGFTLPPGTYDFWFAVDYPMDGILNLSGPILYDNTTVFVQ